ncbi:MAG: hypothetical protein WCF90_10500 [Methanomicrobiales archaeon]
MVEDSAYFCDRYGFCLVPVDPEASHLVSCTLFVQGETFAMSISFPASPVGES